MTERTDQYGSREYYSRSDVVDTYDEIRFSTHGGRLFDRLEKAVLLRCVPDSRDIKILECGSGTGRFSAELGSRGYSELAIDASPGMVEKTAQRIRDAGLEDRVTAQIGDIYNLGFPDESYDFVYSLRVLNQFASNDDKARAITEMARVVAPGGWLLFDVVNRHSLAMLRRGSWHISRSMVNSTLRKASMTPAKLYGRMTFTQTLLNIKPNFLASAVNALDHAFSSVIPIFGTRLYFLARKSPARPAE